jgi:PAP2 superfamily
MSESAVGRLLPIAAYARALMPQLRLQFGPPDENLAQIVRNQFRFNWLLLAIALVVFDLCLLLTTFRIRPLGYLMVLAVACLYGILGNYRGRWFLTRPRAFAMSTALAQIILALAVMTSISYIATAADLPLQDARLFAADLAVGFDFRAILGHVNDRVWLIQILAFGYNAISWEIWLIVVVLPLAGYTRRTAEYISAWLLGLGITCCITMIVPAIGVYQALGTAVADFPNITPQSYLDTLVEIPLLREGALRTLDLGQLLGVVTFPSFHAATAILYGWALWPVRWARPFNLALNGVMLVATPICGGHYLMDVLAGVAVAIAAICAAPYGASLIDRLEQRLSTALNRYPIEVTASS